MIKADHVHHYVMKVFKPETLEVLRRASSKQARKVPTPLLFSVKRLVNEVDVVHESGKGLTKKTVMRLKRILDLLEVDLEPSDGVRRMIRTGVINTALRTGHVRLHEHFMSGEEFLKGTHLERYRSLPKSEAVTILKAYKNILSYGGKPARRLLNETRNRESMSPMDMREFGVNTTVVCENATDRLMVEFIVAYSETKPQI